MVVNSVMYKSFRPRVLTVEVREQIQAEFFTRSEVCNDGMCLGDQEGQGKEEEEE